MIRRVVSVDVQMEKAGFLSLDKEMHQGYISCNASQ